MLEKHLWIHFSFLHLRKEITQKLWWREYFWVLWTYCGFQGFGKSTVFAHSILYIRMSNLKRRQTMDEFQLIFSSTLGTIFYSVVVFVAGALIGAPLWNWVNKKFPWNKWLLYILITSGSCCRERWERSEGSRKTPLFLLGGSTINISILSTFANFS